MAVHPCNPSYTGGKERRITVQGWPGKKLVRLYLKNKFGIVVHAYNHRTWEAEKYHGGLHSDTLCQKEKERKKRKEKKERTKKEQEQCWLSRLIFQYAKTKHRRPENIM
jgi:hypothetical protein